MGLERVGPDHPQCCKRNNPTSACHYKAEPGSEYCSLHGGSAASAANGRQELRNYKLNSVYAGRAKQLGDSPAIKNLNDEIALLRTTLEVVFNSIKSENEMLLYVDKIEKLVKGVQNAVESLQKLQEKNKELLSRDTVMAIFDGLMDKIVEHIQDPDTIKCLADEGFSIIQKHISA